LIEMSVNYADRARALVGTRFRAQGRGGEGLDCVGVILRTFDLDADTSRRSYRLRGDHHAELEAGLLSEFRRVALTRVRPGDVMLMRVADDQLHVGVRTRDGFVHAHAGFGRVVETPGMPEWPLVSAFRKRVRIQGI
jgi:hypothetical protein